MSLCSGCHLIADPARAQPDARPVVRSAFSHAKHAARGTAGAQCATCHPTASETDARELPHATAPMCAIAGCHDGAAAFPTTASCTRCHQDVPKGKYEVARPDTPFSHAKHLAFTVFVGCTTCHAVAPSGEVRVADHAQCAPCHAEDFGRRDPVTCGACHDATEPWRKLIPDRPPLQHSEFGASLDHGKHGAACTSCHNLTTASAQLRPPRGHRACGGSGCHAPAGGPTPAFTQCDGCHDLGLAERREAQRARAPWSVRQRFTHAKHERAPDGNALACTSCHVDMTGPDLLSIATPQKSACVACHDGQTAFKVTGTGCARCHPSKP
jgi:c(7)-type cytochrome triheme protein